MNFILATILAILALSTSYVLTAPTYDHDTYKIPTLLGLRSGCGYDGCHIPQGVFGLERNGRKYHQLCDKNPSAVKHPHRPVACFNTQLQLLNNLSAPSPKKLDGVIDGSGTNFALFAGQSVTLAKTLEIHVEKIKHGKDKKHCVKVKIYQLSDHSIQVRETWCAQQFQPIIL